MRELLAKLVAYVIVSKPGIINRLPGTAIPYLANFLLFLRPLGYYQGWSHGSGENRPDALTVSRMMLWERSAREELPIPVRARWYRGVQLTIHLGTDASRPLYVGGCYEPNHFAFLADIVRPGMIFVDAGANQGWFTAFVSKLVGEKGRVLAVEPSQREFARLVEAVRAAALVNVTCRQVALSNHNGSAILKVAERHEGHNTLGGFIYEGVGLLRTEDVTLRTLDSLVEEEGLERIDVIKIDVEGSEYHVLQGAKRTIDKFKPTFIIEVQAASLDLLGSKPEQIRKCLLDADYDLFTFSEEFMGPTPMRSDRTSSEGAFDLIAIQESRAPLATPYVTEG